MVIRLAGVLGVQSSQSSCPVMLRPLGDGATAVAQSASHSGYPGHTADALSAQRISPELVRKGVPFEVLPEV